MAKSNVKCETCEIVFEKENSELERRSRHFCSTECYKIYQKTHTAHTAMVEKLNEKFGDVYSEIRKEYVDNKISEIAISKIIGTSRGFVATSLTKMGIKRRGHKEQNLLDYKNGRRIVNTKNANKATRELVRKGEHPFQKVETHIKANKVLAQTKYGTYIEKKMEWLLNELKLDYEHSYMIFRKEKRSSGQRRFYKVDFYLPEYDLVIECDGEYWHKDKQKDKIREEEIIALGSKNILRFTGNQIRNDVSYVKKELMKYVTPELVDPSALT